MESSHELLYFAKIDDNEFDPDNMSINDGEVKSFELSWESQSCFAWLINIAVFFLRKLLAADDRSGNRLKSPD
jgi:hypothetical protein